MDPVEFTAGLGEGEKLTCEWVRLQKHGLGNEEKNGWLIIMSYGNRYDPADARHGETTFTPNPKLSPQFVISAHRLRSSFGLASWYTVHLLEMLPFLL